MSGIRPMCEGGARRTIPSMSTTTVTTFVQRLLGPVQALPDGRRRAASRSASRPRRRRRHRRASRSSTRAARRAGRSWSPRSPASSGPRSRVDDGHAVADPFRPTGELVALLVGALAPAAPQPSAPPPGARAAARLPEGGLRPPGLELTPVRYRTRRVARIPADSCPRRVHQSLYFPDLQPPGRLAQLARRRSRARGTSSPRACRAG